ncbi:MAG: hypothetical protein HN348_30910 [Proteobacteria bacterium]|nr:hypothetical protein [Pseudomonadota bacterium]
MRVKVRTFVVVVVGLGLVLLLALLIGYQQYYRQPPPITPPPRQEAAKDTQKLLKRLVFRRDLPRQVDMVELPLDKEPPTDLAHLANLELNSNDEGLSLNDLSPKRKKIAETQLNANRMAWTHDCVMRWLVEEGASLETEMHLAMALDQDGLFSLVVDNAPELPDHVLDCIENTLWDAKWPDLRRDGMLVRENTHTLIVGPNVTMKNIEQMLKVSEEHSNLAKNYELVPDDVIERGSFTIDVDAEGNVSWSEP